MTSLNTNHKKKSTMNILSVFMIVYLFITITIYALLLSAGFPVLTVSLVMALVGIVVALFIVIFFYKITKQT